MASLPPFDWPHAGRRHLAAVGRLGLVALFVATTFFASAPGAAAASPVVDPDRNSGDVTAWSWGANQTPAQIGVSAQAGYRPIDIEVNSSAPTFSVSYVHNSGTYGRGWWWYYNQTAAEVGANLNANNARPIDIEPYDTPAGLRFAVVMVSNTLVAGKGYWWFYNQTAASIGSFTAANNARVVDLDRYTTAAGDRFNVILIPNTGVDGSAWWIYYNQSPSAIGNALSANNARLIDIERTPSGGYDVVMVPGNGVAQWWYHSQTVSSLGNLASQLGARISKIEPYLVNGTRYFAALLINNVDPETSRIRDLVSDKMLPSWGFYVKKVGGSDIVGLQPDRVFEPASMIKVVHAVTAMREVQNNPAMTLLTPITWYAHPDEPARYPSDPNYSNPDGTDKDPADKFVCAYDSSGTLLTGSTYSDPMMVIISQMITRSDNRTTDALTRRYGFDGLNATAALAKMTRTHIYHRVGCGNAASPQPFHKNELTLRDAGRIYEGVENGALLAKTFRDTLYATLVGGIVKADSPMGKMIKQEALAARLDQLTIDKILGQTLVLSKGGGYNYCATNGPCTIDSTAGGVAFFPFKSGQTPYVWGQFFNISVDCTAAAFAAKTCTQYNDLTSAYSVASVEKFRSVIREVVASW
jgi:Beta-lactamase enzyme family